MKKKLSQILAIVLAVSCLSGCEFLFEESGSNSESGYTESVELENGETSETVNIQSEKVNSEAEWNAAFDAALWGNYVYLQQSV